MNEFYSVAHEYRFEYNWSVFPLCPRAKTPYLPFLPVEHKPSGTRGWRAFQTRLPTELELMQWWELTSKGYPCNIAIVTGKISDIFVLDCDSEAAINHVFTHGHGTGMVASTGKGMHFYYRYPDFPLGNRAGVLPGMDVRGEGGYVVAPRSIHPNGHTYTWWPTFKPFEPAPAPSWLIDLLKAPERSNLNESHSRGLQPVKVYAQSFYARTALEREISRVLCAGEGLRNNQLNLSAFSLGQLIGDGLLNRTGVEETLLEAALRIGLGERESRATINSGITAGIAKPRSARQRAG